ncbi:MAG: DUF4297 domain-containing protein [Calditrichaceae bacterium]|nr:DUF4297 domain-containing protein [Calditrichaceae bacterium]
MGLFEELVLKPVAESAGSFSAKAFDYQKNWALAKLLQYHKDGKDYVFAFEFHDDIIVFDSEINPSAVEFFQVKTSRGKNWTIHRLTQQQKAKDGSLKFSILGKLFQHKIDFRNNKTYLNFVTDAFFSFKLDGNLFWFNELEDANKKDIRDKMNSEISNLLNKDFDDLCFQHSEISLDGHETYILGKLQEFFTYYFGDNHNVPVNAWYKTITDEIRQKNNNSPTDIKNIDDLLRNKCISKSNIEKFLNDIKATRNIKPVWNAVESTLINLNYPTRKLISLRNEWNKYSIDCLDNTNNYLIKLADQIAKEISKLNLDDINIVELIDYVYTNIENIIIDEYSHLKTDYVKAIILWKYCESS